MSARPKRAWLPISTGSGLRARSFYPLVRLSGSVGTNATDLENLFDIVTGNVFAGLSQLIFDGGRVRGQIESAQAIADGSLAAWRQTILAALEDVETSAVDLRTSGTRVEALIEANDGAQNAALLARSQYQAGLIDFQTLLVAESQLPEHTHRAGQRRSIAGARLCQPRTPRWAAGGLCRTARDWKNWRREGYPSERNEQSGRKTSPAWMNSSAPSRARAGGAG